MFKKLQQAKEVLADPEKRQLYDRFGMAGIKGGMGGGGGHPMGDFMSGFFGGGGFGGGGRSRQRRVKKSSPIKKEVWLSLEDVYNGPMKDVEIKYEHAEGGGVCEECGGTGVVMETIRRGSMILQRQSNCPRCDGEKYTYRKKRTKTSKIKVPVPKGATNELKITLEGKGHNLPGQERGDVIVEFKIEHDPIFNRVGSDLAMGKDITLLEALVGFTISVKHVSGQTLQYTYKGTTRPNQIRKFPGWGLPQLGGSLGMVGNLLVKFNVIFPLDNSYDQNLLKECFGKANMKWEKEDSSDESKFGPGVRVKLVNLNNYPALNGKLGTIVHPTERDWAVQLDPNGKHEGKLVSISEERLEIVADKKKKKRKGSRRGSRKGSEEMEEDAYEEEVTGEFVDENAQPTPAVAPGSAHQEDEEQRSERASNCRQM